MTESRKGIIVAIDGPAGSGKSTAARQLARAEGLHYLNTGAMYRAVAHLASEGGIDAAAQPERAAEVARAMDFEYRVQGDALHFWVASKAGARKEDLTPVLFTAALTEKLQPVVTNEAIRAVLVEKMRAAARAVLSQGAKGVVLEGRDIGTVVFPDASIKFYIHADLDARAQRRAAELAARGEKVELGGLMKQIARRDDFDEQRTVGPLKRADDALDVDTSHLDVDQTLAKLRAELKARLG